MFTAAGKTALGTLPNYIEDVFSTYLYTGNGSTQTITNGIDLLGKGGLVWIKSRSATWSNYLIDSARGQTKFLVSNTTAAQDDFGDGSFSSTGFTTASSTAVTQNNTKYASWTFRKQAKFFDVVTYTGDGTNDRAINHNLGSVPGCIIVKRTDAVSAWSVYHRSLPAGTYNRNLYLNTTAAYDTNVGIWGTSDPTATQFRVGAVGNLVNVSGGTYVAYLFAHNAGGFGAAGTDNVISCGTFTQSSAVDVSVSLGYEPQWVMIKRSDSTGQWYLLDDMRGFLAGSNTVQSNTLYANLTNAEAAFTIQKTSTGFTWPSGQFSVSAGTYIYIAIRRGPMKVPTSGTSVFQSATYAGNNSTTAGQDVSTNFPMDFAFTRYNRAGAGDWDAISRLQGLSTTASGSRYLNPYNTNAEATGGYLWQTSQLLLKMYGFPASTTQLNYFFQRAPGFFDVVCYTGTAAAQTQSHNLGVAPELMIVKRRSAAASWAVYSSALGNTKSLELNQTGAVINSVDLWNSTTPTSSVFSIGGSDTSVNASGSTYVAYLFATVAGVSKVGSYTGTGTTKQIDCGFAAGARFVLIKRTDSTGDWYVWDSARGIVAGNDPYLLLNSTAAEVTNTDYVDTYSAGFEISSTAPSAINANGGTFIFLAIA